MQTNLTLNMLVDLFVVSWREHFIHTVAKNHGQNMQSKSCVDSCGFKGIICIVSNGLDLMVMLFNVHFYLKYLEKGLNFERKAA